MPPTALGIVGSVVQVLVNPPRAVSWPRVTAIQRVRNVTLGVLEGYLGAVGGRLVVSVVKRDQKILLIRVPHWERAVVGKSRPYPVTFPPPPRSPPGRPTRPRSRR